MPYELSLPNALKAQLYFHLLVLLSLQVRLKKIIVTQNAMSGMLAGMAVQLVGKAWYALTNSCSLGPCAS